MPVETTHPSPNGIPAIAQPRPYRITLRGQINRGWIAAFDLLSIWSTDECTTLEALVDQAALRGLLNHLWDLNLDIIAVVEVDRQPLPDGGS